MKIEKTIYVTINKEEKNQMRRVEAMFEKICQTFEMCIDCPLHTICSVKIREGSIDSILNQAINSLKVEEE